MLLECEKNLIYLQDANSTEVGQHEHPRKTAVEMLMVATSVGKEEINLFLTSANPFMNPKPNLCVRVDKATDYDAIANQNKMIDTRANYKGTPVTFYFGLPEIDGDYTGDDIADSGEKEADSGVCVKKFIGAPEHGAVLIDEHKNPAARSRTIPIQLYRCRYLRAAPLDCVRR